jgi:hypothetical protein
MKKIDKIKTFLLLSAAAVFVAGCNDELEDNLFTGNENSIAIFTLAKDGVTLKGALSPNAVVITAPERVSLSGAAASVTLSENAAITPDPATVTDWDAAQTFTVTSYSGSKRTYAYSVERRLTSRDGDAVLLTQADVNAFVAELDADQINGTITVGAAAGQDSVYSLAGMEQLKVVTGGIIINATYAGKELTVFENLEKTGDLKISSKKVKTVSFPKLAAIRLDFNFDQAVSVTGLDFPELATVDKGVRIVYPDSLTNISFPKLQLIIEGLTVQGRYSGTNTLQTLEFPALTEVGGTVNLTYLRNLAGVNFPELTVAGAITSSYLDSMTFFTVPKLETVASGGISVSSSHKITELTFPALKTVSGELYLNTSKLELLSCPLLERLGRLGSTLPSGSPSPFPSLKIVDGQLSVDKTYGSNLLALFPALDSVGTLYINYGNYEEETLDMRGIKTGAISSLAMGKIILLADDIFPARITVTNDYPFIVREGLKSIGCLRINSAQQIDAVDFSFLEYVRDEIQLSSVSRVETLEFPNLWSAGRLYFYYCNALKTLSLPKLETITGYVSGTTTTGDFIYAVSSDITAIELPALRSIVGGISITGLTATRKLETVNFSALQSLTGTLTITGTNNAAFKDLSGFSALTSAGGVTISNFTQLNDFSPLRNVLPSLSTDTWKVAGCGYNPSYQDMTDGLYAKP